MQSINIKKAKSVIKKAIYQFLFWLMLFAPMVLVIGIILLDKWIHSGFGCK